MIDGYNGKYYYIGYTDNYNGNIFNIYYLRKSDC